MNTGFGKRRSPARKVFSVILTVIIVLIIIAAAFFGILTIAEYRPASSEALIPEGTSSAALSAGSTFTVMTWNIGYGALDETTDFFMDGGSMVLTASEEQIHQNLDGMLKEIQEVNPDILLLQEVDRDSSRSRHIDEKAFFQSALTNHQSTYALNYKAAFVPYPLPPLGKVDAGLLTFSRYPLVSSTRIQLPVPFSWPLRIVNLKRCLDIERIPVDNSDKELVLMNLHLEAYDSGEGKLAQTNMLREYLQAEQEKGNFVIAGGDFNQIFSHIDSSAYPVLADRWQPGQIDADDLGPNWQCIMDPSVPSCRSLDQPYAGADHENFQYYLIDGFIVSDNLVVKGFHTADLQFANSDHNPLIMEVFLPED